MKMEMNKKQITERLEELEEIARRNREKWDDNPLTDWLDDEQQEEHEKLLGEWNKK